MTIFFAGLSAVFAGFSFLVIYLDYKRNNAKAEIKMNRVIAFFGSDHVEYANCSIVNKGRRPIKITGFHFLLSDNQALFILPTVDSPFLMNNPQFPEVLNEMDRMEFSIRMEYLKMAFSEASAKVSYLCFRDTTDKIHRFRIQKKNWSEFF